MSLPDLVFLYRARLRTRTMLVQESFAVLGIAVGVALLFASQVASTSLDRSVQELTSQIVGNTQYQLDARGPNGFDERLLGKVRALPGVRTALPVLEQQASVIGPRGQRSVDLIGTDPRFAHLAGSLLRHFSAAQLAAQQAIALPSPVAQSIGALSLQTIKLQIGASEVTTLLGTVLGPADIGGLVHSPVALAPVGYAQRLTGMTGRITRIFVQAKAGRSRELQAGLSKLAAANGVNVESASFDAQLFGVAAAPESQGELLFSAVSALVGFMFALNAMLITVPSRRRLIKLVSLQGASRPKIIQIMLFDAFILGVLACVLGLVLGELLSISVFHSTPGYLSFAFPVGSDRIVTWQSVLLAIVAGMTAACVGVLWPLRDIVVRPRWHPRRRTAVRLGGGLISLGLTATVLLFDPRAAALGDLTLVIALLCLLPFLFDGVVAVFERAQRPFHGASPVIAITELRTAPNRVRSLAIAATAAIAVFGCVAVEGSQSNLQRGLDASARGIDSSADVWVTPKGESNAFATTSFRKLDLKAIRSLPGVSGVALYRGSFLDWGNRRLWVLAPPGSSRQPIPPTQLLSGGVPRAAARIRTGGWAVLSQALASEYHLHIGQSFSLPSPRPITLRVAALSTNLGWPPGAIILAAEDYARAWGSSDPSAYQINLTPGASPATVRRLVQQALGPETGLAVETSLEREHLHYALADQGLARMTQIRLLVLIAAVLAVAGALSAMIWQRRDLVAFVKVQGYRKPVLWRWLCCEGALLVAAGCGIGAVFGLCGQLVVSNALASATGFPISLNVEVLAALSGFALVSVVASAVIALPGYLVVRVPPRTVSPTS
jgi:putative ABC transport system permease protein